MQFNSYFFILFFLPICVIGYFLLNRIHFTAGMLYLLGMSLWFYGYFNTKYLMIILSSIVVNFLLSKIINVNNIIIKKTALTIGVSFNIGLLFYFKYYDFFIQNINQIFQKNFNLQNILLPLGISFFTFQQLSYIIDSYNGKTGGYRFFEYALFVSFFPQLVAGPIVLHDELIPFFRNNSIKKVNFDNLVQGIIMFVLGLFKKVLIADLLGRMVTWGFENIEAATSMDFILVMLAYTFQIYFDFSGYSDMAVGIAQMFNFKLPINFDSPYKACSILDFWKRWHMTLTRFLRTYIYFPLGGSKRGTVRTYLNILIVFLLSGLWHGANYTFILWGALHGVAQCINRFFKKQYDTWHFVVQWGITFIFLNFTWLLFRADNLKQWEMLCKKIISLSDLQVSSQLMDQVRLPEIDYLYNNTKLGWLNGHIKGFTMWLVFAGCFWLVLNCTNNQRRQIRPGVFTLITIPVLLLWCLVSLGSISVFLYFNF